MTESPSLSPLNTNGGGTLLFVDNSAVPSGTEAYLAYACYNTAICMGKLTICCYIDSMRACIFSMFARSAAIAIAIVSLTDICFCYKINHWMPVTSVTLYTGVQYLICAYILTIIHLYKVQPGTLHHFSGVGLLLFLHL